MAGSGQGFAPRAPGIQIKLDQAIEALADLERRGAELVLEAAEGKAGAEKLLAAHRDRAELAQKQVSELRGALVLAERLDREAAAQQSAAVRATQLAAFAAAMAARERAMSSMLEAVGAMAAAFHTYAKATLEAQLSVPFGASLPIMNMGVLGNMGSAFGSGEALIAAELFRVAPAREDGRGRWAVPFARSPSPLQNDHRKLNPGVDEFRSANDAILRSVEQQVAALDQQQMAAAASAEKDAA